ncbi:hypothetical protein T484DRAFT_1757852 [Baffinella frigidus]|nr:hypothetical protein T484DRAFT_1757852 [Cryptophyta sp. CCMP2293]
MVIFNSAGLWYTDVFYLNGVRSRNDAVVQHNTEILQQITRINDEAQNQNNSNVSELKKVLAETESRFDTERGMLNERVEEIKRQFVYQKNEKEKLESELMSANAKTTEHRLQLDTLQEDLRAVEERCERTRSALEIEKSTGVNNLNTLNETRNKEKKTLEAEKTNIIEQLNAMDVCNKLHVANNAKIQDELRCNMEGQLSLVEFLEKTENMIHRLDNDMGTMGVVYKKKLERFNLEREQLKVAIHTNDVQYQLHADALITAQNTLGVVSEREINHTGAISEGVERIDRLNEEVSTHKQVIARIQDESRMLNGKLQTLRGERDELVHAHDSLKSARDQMQTELTDKVHTLQGQYDTLKLAHTTTQNNLKLSEQEGEFSLKMHQVQIEHLKKLLKEGKTKLEASTDELKKEKAKTKTSSAQLTDAKRQIRKQIEDLNDQYHEIMKNEETQKTMRSALVERDHRIQTLKKRCHDLTGLAGGVRSYGKRPEDTNQVTWMIDDKIDIFMV